MEVTLRHAVKTWKLQVHLLLLPAIFHFQRNLGLLWKQPDQFPVISVY